MIFKILNFFEGAWWWYPPKFFGLLNQVNIYLGKVTNFRGILNNKIWRNLVAPLNELSSQGMSSNVHFILSLVKWETMIDEFVFPIRFTTSEEFLTIYWVEKALSCSTWLLTLPTMPSADHFSWCFSVKIQFTVTPCFIAKFLIKTDNFLSFYNVLLSCHCRSR